MLDAQLSLGRGRKSARWQGAADGIKPRARGYGGSGEVHVAEPHVKRIQSGVQIVSFTVADYSIAEVAHFQLDGDRVVGLQAR